MNSKRRCATCHGYFPREEFIGHDGFCSLDCLAAHRTRLYRKAAKVTRKRQLTFTPELKRIVKERDGNRCRWCGRGDLPLHVHHIAYRSEGGPDEEWNLITLCQTHHNLAHSDKRAYKPLLEGVMWLWYFEGKKLNVPQYHAWLQQFDVDNMICELLEIQEDLAA